MAQDPCPHCGHTTTTAGSRLWTPDELAVRWDVPAHSIRRMIRTGLLASQRIGPFHKVPGAEVDRFERCEPPEQLRKTA